MKPQLTLTSGEAPRLWLFCLLVFVLSLVVYLPVLDGPALWDDEQLLKTPLVERLHPLQDYWSSGFWIRPDVEPEGRNYYRPLTILSLAFDRHLHGEATAGFHLTNILVHALNAVLVLLISFRLRASATFSTVLALLFSWFPRLTEAVAWISGRTDALAAFFSLVALRLALSDVKGKYVWSGGAVLLGLFAKEVALATALGVLLQAWLAPKAKGAKGKLLAVAPTLLLTGFYLLLRTRAIGGGLSSSSLSWWERSAAALEAIGRYAFMIVDGFHPNIQMGALPYRDLRFVVLGGLVLLALLCSLWALRRRLAPQQAALLTAGWGAIGLVCHIVPITVDIVAADRFLYLPLACFLPLASSLPRRSDRPILALSLVLLLVYAPTTWLRNQIWADKIDFWGTVYREQTVYNGTSRIELGNILLRNGLFEEADYVYSTTDRLNGFHFAFAAHNRAVLQLIKGQPQIVIPLLEELSNSLDVPKFSVTLSRVYAASGREEEARSTLLLLLAKRPSLEEAQRVLDSLPHIRAALGSLRRLPQSTEDYIEQARNFVQLGFSRLAMGALMTALSRADFPPEELGGTLSFAFQYGTPEELEDVYRSFEILHGDPEVRQSYEERMTEVAKLRALFLELHPELDVPATEPSPLP